MKTRTNNHQTGFTIIELMIATLVFSVILLVITTGVIQFTQAYYKGIHTSSIQDRSRTIIDTFAQAIEFSGSTVTTTDTNNFFCAGGKLFSFTRGVEYTGTVSAANLGLFQQDIPTGSSCPTTAPLPINAINGVELLAPSMRIANLEVAQVTGNGVSNMYSIKLRVVYGDDDLLDNPTDTTANCKIQAGSQFCAVSELSTIVQERVQ